MITAKIFPMAVMVLALFLAEVSTAGEILIGPSGGGSRSPSSDNREKARDYIKEDRSESGSPNIVIVPDHDGSGIFSPRIMELPQDNRSKARDYIRDKDSGTSLPAIIVPPSGSRSDSTRDAAERQRNKARGYVDGWDGATGSKPGTYVQIGTSMGVTGKDGIIVFDCAAISNVAGRIGDDLRSGSDFIVVINGKNHKARCR